MIDRKSIAGMLGITVDQASRLDLPVRPPISDAELMADLRAIDVEVARRKKAYPFEPYAVWAMTARQDALASFERRVAASHDLGRSGA